MTMVVPFAAGGPMDTLARILQPALGETLGQQIIIENVPGGGGMTGSLRVSQAAVDSHMFVLASIGTHAIGYSMHSKPPYHPANDFQPVDLRRRRAADADDEEGPAAEQSQGVHRLHQGQPRQDDVLAPAAPAPPRTSVA